MLRHMGLTSHADRIQKAVLAVIAEVRGHVMLLYFIILY